MDSITVVFSNWRLAIRQQFWMAWISISLITYFPQQCWWTELRLENSQKKVFNVSCPESFFYLSSSFSNAAFQLSCICLTCFIAILKIFYSYNYIKYMYDRARKKWVSQDHGAIMRINKFYFFLWRKIIIIYGIIAYFNPVTLDCDFEKTSQYNQSCPRPAWPRYHCALRSYAC